MKTIVGSLIFWWLSSVSYAAEINQPLFDQGRLVYDQICSACHNYMPPPKAAPPMLGISAHYHQAFTDSAKAIAHIIDYLKKPAPEKSKLPPMVISRWGLMVPPVLSEEQLNAVAYWVWETLAVECAKNPMLGFCKM